MATVTPNVIIDRAFRLIGVASDDRNLPGERVQEGFDLLNALVDEFSSESSMIPYETSLSFNMVIGQDVYEISNLVSADITSNPLVTLSFVRLEDLDLKYPVGIVEPVTEWSNRKNVNLTGRPRQVYVTREVNKSFLNFREKPDKNYATELFGKFILDNLTLSTDISNLPPRYNLFLEYALARLLTSRYPGSVWNELSEKKYNEMLESGANSNDKELNVITSNALLQSNRRYYNIFDT